jgi:hypothetical protein
VCFPIYLYILIGKMSGLTLSYLNTLTPLDRQDAILREFIKCKRDPIYCIQTYFTVLDAAKGQRVPFMLYPHQVKAIRAFEEHPTNMTMKTRQMGFTAVSSAYVAWYMCTKQHQVINALAQEKKTSRKFLRQVRETLDYARTIAPWLVADYAHNNNGKDSFTLKTGCIITAEANKPDACRGDTINLLIIDEVAAISHMDEIWASAGLTLTKSKGKCIAISTPKGQSGWYFEQYINAEENGWNIVEAHWSEHPDYKKGMYQFIKDNNHTDGGYVKFFNEDWPDVSDAISLKKYKTKATYNFVLDGKMRSPWYDYESRRLGVQKTRCELDCSFSGSGSEVLDPEIVRALGIKAKENPPLPASEINIDLRGPWKSYKQFRLYNPHHSYIMSCDVATGDGSDFSTVVVYNMTTKEVVATYKENIDPLVFARIAKEIATRFGSCMIIVEYQGPGLTVLLELKGNLRYSNIFYSTTKSREVTKNQKRKIGFWQSDSTRTLGGDQLEESLNLNEISVYSEDFIAELHTWIWDTDGKRRHAPGKHDDLIMALTNLLYVVHYVLAKRETNNSMMKSQFRRFVTGFQDEEMMTWDDYQRDIT